MARTTRDTFLAWVTDNILTGNPKNITASKIREMMLRIADNVRCTIGSAALSAPQAIVGMTATPVLIELDDGTSLVPEELIFNAADNSIDALLAIYAGGWLYDTFATAFIEGPVADVILYIMKDGVEVSRMQTALQGPGIPVKICVPIATEHAIADSQFTLMVGGEAAGPIDITVHSARLQVRTIPGMN